LGKPLFIDFIHDFCQNGTVILSLGSYSMRFYAFQGAITFSISLVESKDSMIYSYTNALASFQVNYTLVKNGFKITLKGSQQTKGSLGLTFQSSSRISYDSDGVWLKDQGVQLGFNFSDCKAIVSVGNGLSFSLGTSFDVDPSTVATVTGSGQMLMTPQVRTFNDVNGNYWCYYRNSSQVLAEWSTDGVTWGNTPINVVNLTSGLTDQEGWISVRYYLYSGTYYVYNAYQKVINGAVFFRRDTLSGTTLTLGTERTVLAAITGYVFNHVDVEAAVAGMMILVAFSRQQLGPPYELTSLVYKSATNDGSGGFSYSLGTSIKYGSSYPCVSGLTRLTEGKAYLIYYDEYGPTVKGKLMNIVVWGSEETVVSRLSAIGVSFAMNCYNNDVFFGWANWVLSPMVDDYTFCPYLCWRNYTSSTWAAKEDLTNKTVPNCLNIQMCVNASTGDLWFFSHNGFPLTSGVYNYYYSFRSYATKAWSLNKTIVFNEQYMDSYSDFVTQNPVSGRYIGITYGYTTGGGASIEVRYYVLDLSPPPSGAWHDLATWTATLVTRQWLNVSTFTEALVTRQWSDIASWSESLVTRTWIDVTSWNQTLMTRQWNDVATWTQDLQTRLWHEMATWQQDPATRTWHDVTWLFDLSISGWRDIALWTITLGKPDVPYIIPILFLGCLVGAILLVAFMKKKGS
jgi:hypothetical protein